MSSQGNNACGAAIVAARRELARHRPQGGDRSDSLRRSVPLDSRASKCPQIPRDAYAQRESDEVGEECDVRMDARFVLEGRQGGG
jgi:hypothetical protein